MRTDKDIRDLVRIGQQRYAGGAVTEPASKTESKATGFKLPSKEEMDVIERVARITGISESVLVGKYLGIDLESDASKRQAKGIAVHPLLRHVLAIYLAIATVIATVAIFEWAVIGYLKIQEMTSF